MFLIDDAEPMTKGPSPSGSNTNIDGPQYDASGGGPSSLPGSSLMVEERLLQSWKARLACRKATFEYYEGLPWDNSLALSNQANLGSAFDRRSLSREVPLKDFKIPWPILQHLLSFSIQEITGQWVAKFIDSARMHISISCTWDLININLMRFHQDKWEAKWQFVHNDKDRALVRTAVRTVYQKLIEQCELYKALHKCNIL